jgi:hypothetical protein
MTKSAKQDAKQPAQPAVPESAATQGVPAAGSSAADSAAADGTATGSTAETEQGSPGIDDTKRKFREALERKNQAHSEGQGRGGRDGGKINGAHGPAASRRSFRRKSG